MRQTRKSYSGSQLHQRFPVIVALRAGTSLNAVSLYQCAADCDAEARAQLTEQEERRRNSKNEPTATTVLQRTEIVVSSEANDLREQNEQRIAGRSGDAVQ